MSLRSLNLKKAYSSDFDDILHDFYIPALEVSIEYDRLAGFFTSSSLAIAARGISGLIKNNGVMKLIVSPKLNKDDLKVILESHRDPQKYIEKKMLEELENLEDEFVKDHIYALGWMVANKKLEIKVAIVHNCEGRLLTSEDVENSGLFHQKVGILKDSEGSIVTFSGSMNETARGWLENIEEFKVFRSWEQSEEEYVKTDILKFNRFWNSQSLRVKTIDVPLAVKEKLIEIAPKDIEEIDLHKWYMLKKKKKVKLFKHQEEAVRAWILNGMRGIFEMATGTGKTYAALGCLHSLLKSNPKLVTVITTPYQHLVQQWKREINKFGIEFDDLIIADSSNPNWKNLLIDSMIDVYLSYKNNIIILVTHRTFASDDFVKIIQSNKYDSSFFLIADEVHNIGAKKSRKGLIDEYDLRLGLSATPKRWFDTVGTEILYDYFGGVVYEFGLEQAIIQENPATGETYLVPYRYIPKFISLNNEELENYIEKSRAIAMKLNKIKDEVEKDILLENLLFKRADIVKNAVAKYKELENILEEIPSPIKWTIIYCSPEQIDVVMKILNKSGLIAHRFTMDEGTTPSERYGGISERDYILNKFAEGKYQILVAMKCLDEGVDIPPARTAILMASSGNPREYIQRIGRIIRRYKNKIEATIYDIVVVPSFNGLPTELKEIEWNIFEKELRRYEEIAKIALNNAEALRSIFKIKNRLLEAKG
jgi:superfamily II DNA or RNA helicase